MFDSGFSTYNMATKQSKILKNVIFNTYSRNPSESNQSVTMTAKMCKWVISKIDIWIFYLEVNEVHGFGLIFPLLFILFLMKYILREKQKPCRIYAFQKKQLSYPFQTNSKRSISTTSDWPRKNPDMDQEKQRLGVEKEGPPSHRYQG